MTDREADILAYRISKAVYENNRAEFDHLGGENWDDPAWESLRDVAKRLGEWNS